jgi:hypothetical protein
MWLKFFFLPFGILLYLSEIVLTVNLYIGMIFSVLVVYEAVQVCIVKDEQQGRNMAFISPPLF